ncbi:MAG: SH3 domain-containing protein [Candidatus Competibacteraceae bacterium]|nr:SH3 domain-containing protein [Candidatus Competibacteraceae bacterium]
MKKISGLMGAFLFATSLHAFDLKAYIAAPPDPVETKSVITAYQLGEFGNDSPFLHNLAAEKKYKHLSFALNIYARDFQDTGYGYYVRTPYGLVTRSVWINPLETLIENETESETLKTIAEKHTGLFELESRFPQKAGRVPLATAVWLDRVDAARLLLSLGADVNTTKTMSTVTDSEGNLLEICKSPEMESLLREYHIREFSERRIPAFSNAMNLNVRKGPGTDYPSLGKLFLNEKVTIVKYPYRPKMEKNRRNGRILAGNRMEIHERLVLFAL